MIDIICFNPRSREGSDRNVLETIAFSNVSIHAPAKGATTTAAPAHSLPMVSIHAPAKGATLPRRATFVLQSQFQSTLPRRERHSWHGAHDLICRVSIHAPAKGATVSNPFRSAQSFTVSIHAPAKGATPHGDYLRVLTVGFQSTLPRRERH